MNSAKTVNTALKTSFFIEDAQVKLDLGYPHVDGFRVRGLTQYHLKNRDAFSFMESRPDDRLIFAMESGLFPNV